MHSAANINMNSFQKCHSLSLAETGFPPEYNPAHAGRE
ncbi:hypothetical protein ASZ90_005913 [hydrocarbon metagenome]|uniref:Uncharacterized protein n=1 Tax=hydrocarbon metagenome TaxID=938273 RepID=A0A0W8FTS0_9ZZZZ